MTRTVRTPAGVAVRLHLRRLLGQRLRTLLAVGAVAAGTSLALGVVVVLSSTTASLAAFGRSIGGPAPLRIAGATVTGGIPPRVVVAAARTPGVAGVVPVVQLSSVVRTGDGATVSTLVVGAGCGAARLVGLPGCTGGIGGPTGLYVGGTLGRHLGPSSWLQTDLGTVPLGTAVRLPSLDRVAGGRVVVTGLARAQVLYHRGQRVDVVYVTLRPGVPVAAEQARLAQRVGPAFGVLRADQPPAAIDLATSSFVPLLALVAAIAAGIAAVLVYDVVALSLEERRRQQAVLAAVGAPPWLVAGGPVLEAVAIGAVGGLLALGGGLAVAGPVLAPLSAFTRSLFGAAVTVHVTVGDALLGIAFGVAVGLAAAARPVRRMARLDIAGELAERDRRQVAGTSAARRRTAAGVLVLVAGAAATYAGSRHAALAPWQLPTAVAGFLVVVAAGVVVVGAGATLPFAALAAAASSAARRTGRRAGPPGPGRRARRHGRGVRLPAPVRIGVAGAGREPGRVAVMAVAVGAAVAVGTITGGYTQGLAAHTSDQLARDQGRSIVVDTAAGQSGQNAAAHVPAAVVADIARFADVGSIAEYPAVLSGSHPGDQVLVGTTDDPRGGPTLVAGSADPGPFRRGAVMVGTGLARSRHLRPGDRVRLDTPGGVVALPVEGIWANGAVNGDNVTMTVAELDRLFGDQLPESVVVTPRAGVPTDRLLAQLRTLPLPPDVTLTAPGPYRQQQVDQLTGQLAPFWTLERGLLGVAFVGVLATLLLVGLGRRREVALLGAVGLPPGGIVGLVVSEAVAVAVVGAIGGVVLGAVVLQILLMLVPLVVGFPAPYRFDAGILVTTVPLAVALSAIAALLPAWQAARADVVDGLRQD